MLIVKPHKENGQRKTTPQAAHLKQPEQSSLPDMRTAPNSLRRITCAIIWRHRGFHHSRGVRPPAGVPSCKHDPWEFPQWARLIQGPRGVWPSKCINLFYGRRCHEPLPFAVALARFVLLRCGVTATSRIGKFLTMQLGRQMLRGL